VFVCLLSEKFDEMATKLRQRERKIFCKSPISRKGICQQNNPSSTGPEACRKKYHRNQNNPNMVAAMFTGGRAVGYFQICWQIFVTRDCRVSI